MTEEESRAWIDAVSYETLLRKWRFTPSTDQDPMFIGNLGDYYAKVMVAKRDALSPEAAVSVSKHVGWGD